jgi:heme exporter protein C
MTAAPKMAQTMLTAMLLMTFSAWAYAIATAFHRVRTIIVEREALTDWVGRAIDPVGPGTERAP